MIHLSTLAALLRTLRSGEGGIDGPAAAVGRVPPVTPVANDSEAAVSMTPVREAPYARTAPWLERGSERSRALEQPTNASVRSAASGIAMRGAAAGAVSGAVPAVSQPAVPSTALTFTPVAALLQSALRGSGNSAPRPPLVEALSSLVERPEAPVTELARALARSVAESGLFYESHVARWARNEYPRSALDREPQANWSAAAATAGSSAPPAAAPLLADGAAAQVARQLDALETRQLVWNGELWPGQRGTIEIDEQTQPSSEHDTDETRPTASAWRTRVTVDLPSLGRVIASLALSGERFDIAIEAPGADAVARLDAARADLGEALGACRLELHAFSVASIAER